jgi:hypothetical protein
VTRPVTWFSHRPRKKAMLSRDLEGVRTRSKHEIARRIRI